MGIRRWSRPATVRARPPLSSPATYGSGLARIAKGCVLASALQGRARNEDNATAANAASRARSKKRKPAAILIYSFPPQRVPHSFTRMQSDRSSVI